MNLSEKEYYENQYREFNYNLNIVYKHLLATTAVHNRYIFKRIGNPYKKKVMELGCGVGEIGQNLLNFGAVVYFTDYSFTNLNLVQSIYNDRYDIKLYSFEQNANKLAVKDNSIDVVIGHSLLHHIVNDLEANSCEVARILKPGGKAIFFEPIKYNPLNNLMRFINRKYLSPDEKPLSYRQLKNYGKNFSEFTIKGFHFFSLLLFFYMIFFKKFHPVKDKTWKYFIENDEDFGKFGELLISIDNIILTLLPPLKWFCWVVVATYIK